MPISHSCCEDHSKCREGMKDRRQCWAARWAVSSWVLVWQVPQRAWVFQRGGEPDRS